MISGISAMLQIGNNINNLIFMSAFKRNEYYKEEFKLIDKKIMETLNNYSGPDSDVCLKVKEELNIIYENKYTDTVIGSSTKYMTPSKNEFLENSCVLVNNDNRHRVLINKSSNQSSFNLFTCYFEQKKPECPYELNK